MKKISQNITLLFFILLHSLTFGIEQAVVIVPVADLVGDKKAIDVIDNLPLSGGNYKFFESCPRIHQNVLGDEVTLIKDDESAGLAYISILNVYYDFEKGKKEHLTNYWIKRDSLKTIASFKEEDRSKLPPPISFKDPQLQHAHPHPIVTLCLPFYDPITRTNYSAGTRFVQASAELPKKRSKKQVPVHIYDHKADRFHVSVLPNELCVTNKKNQTEKEKIENFVRILRLWTSNDEGFVPYVLGGCSFTHRLKPEPFVHTAINTETETGDVATIGSFYSYPQTDSMRPKTGFDCSNLISRAAQIAEIPYYFKNSRTIEKNLEPLAPGDMLAAGDIIWIYGHVLIYVGDNRVIEASSYNHGCGKVHEVPLEKVFDGIKTAQQLVEKHLKREKVQRLNTLTGKREDLYSVKLFKMSSVWNNAE